MRETPGTRLTLLNNNKSIPIWPQVKLCCNIYSGSNLVASKGMFAWDAVKLLSKINLGFLEFRTADIFLPVAITNYISLHKLTKIKGIFSQGKSLK